jgi:hypothetical protein
MQHFTSDDIAIAEAILRTGELPPDIDVMGSLSGTTGDPKEFAEAVEDLQRVVHGVQLAMTWRGVRDWVVDEGAPPYGLRYLGGSGGALGSVVTDVSQAPDPESTVSALDQLIQESALHTTNDLFRSATADLAWDPYGDSLDIPSRSIDEGPRDWQLLATAALLRDLKEEPLAAGNTTAMQAELRERAAIHATDPALVTMWNEIQDALEEATSAPTADRITATEPGIADARSVDPTSAIATTALRSAPTADAVSARDLYQQRALQIRQGVALDLTDHDGWSVPHGQDALDDALDAVRMARPAPVVRTPPRAAASRRTARLTTSSGGNTEGPDVSAANRTALGTTAELGALRPQHPTPQAPVHNTNDHTFGI